MRIHASQDDSLLLLSESHLRCRHWQTGFSEATSSWNHAWLGSVGSFLYHSVGGISCRDDAYIAACGAIDVRPYPLMLPATAEVADIPAKLPFVEVSYDSIRGVVKSAWSYSRDSVVGETLFNLSATFPANVEATVAVPVWVAGAASSGVSVLACSSECAALERHVCACFRRSTRTLFVSCRCYWPHDRRRRLLGLQYRLFRRDVLVFSFMAEHNMMPVSIVGLKGVVLYVETTSTFMLY